MAIFEAAVIAFSASRDAAITFVSSETVWNRESMMVVEISSRTASNCARVQISRPAATVSIHTAIQSAKSAALVRYGLCARVSFSVWVR